MIISETKINVKYIYVTKRNRTGHQSIFFKTGLKKAELEVLLGGLWPLVKARFAVSCVCAICSARASFSRQI